METVQIAKRFVEKADRLKRTRFGRNGAFGVTWSASNPKTVDVNPLDEDGLDAFLLTLRLFIRDNDPISLRNIFNKVVPSLELSRSVLESVTDLHKVLNDYLDDRLIIPWHIPPLGVVISTNRELLETYLYGHYAHMTPHHAQVVSAFHSWGICRVQTMAEFLHTLEVLTAVIVEIASVLRAEIDMEPAKGV